MYPFLQWIIYLLLFSLASCTDLVAVYKSDILLLRDVDKIPVGSSPMSWEDNVLIVPRPFSYPVGLTYDSQGRRLFVAEAMHEFSKIFALTLDSDYQVTRMEPAVKTSNTTLMEDMTYDPRTGHLYWTDSHNHGVYKSWIPSEKDKNPSPQPEPAHMFGDVIEPRGIAIDYCNELMYWSERDGSGSTPSSIEVCDLHGLSHTVVQQNEGKESNTFYQGLTYDISGGKLLWAETGGDNSRSSHCQIVSYKFGESVPEQEVLVSMENCYPFALTTDENYIYWADWGQEGIMRASRNNPNEIVKLIHSPEIDSKYGGHKGVYGLAILDDLTNDNIQKACKKKSIPQEDIDDILSDSPPASVPDLLQSSAHVKESTEAVEEKIIEEIRTPKESSIERDYTHDIHNTEDSNDDLIHVSLGPAQNFMKAPVCSENQLLIIVIILAVFCVIFMVSTLILALKLWCHKKPRSSKGELPTTVSILAPEVRPRQPKRCGPKTRPMLSGPSSCSMMREDDGVSINIEDCCQMTLCDTPCYTTVKKEGRGYKKSSVMSSKSRNEDKKGLLDDMDDPSTF